MCGSIRSMRRACFLPFHLRPFSHLAGGTRHILRDFQEQLQVLRAQLAVLTTQNAELRRQLADRNADALGLSQTKADLDRSLDEHKIELLAVKVSTKPRSALSRSDSWAHYKASTSFRQRPYLNSCGRALFDCQFAQSLLLSTACHLILVMLKTSFSESFPDLIVGEPST